MRSDSEGDEEASQKEKEDTDGHITILVTPKMAGR